VPVGGLAALGLAARAQGLRVAWTNGVFDLLHPGHIALLEEAKSQADILVVGINSDASTRALKGPTRPVNDQLARAEVLLALRAVDAVCIFDELDPVRALAELRPDVHVKDSDYRDAPMPELVLLAEIGARVHFVERVPGRSTSGIVAAVRGRSEA
jgi:rfaE bifunctional protein nucleotidyltransferase chain/domain